MDRALRLVGHECPPATLLLDVPEAGRYRLRIYIESVYWHTPEHARPQNAYRVPGVGIVTIETEDQAGSLPPLPFDGGRGVTPGPVMRGDVSRDAAFC